MKEEFTAEPFKRQRAFDFSNMSRGQKILNWILIIGGIWAFPPLIFLFIGMAIYYRVKYPGQHGGL